MSTIQQDIEALAAQIGVDPSSVEFMAQHVADTMGEAMVSEENEAMQVEMMRAGVEDSQRAMRKLTTRALTRSGEFQTAIYDILKERQS